jgi:hypothetical protein
MSNEESTTPSWQVGVVYQRAVGWRAHGVIDPAEVPGARARQARR